MLRLLVVTLWLTGCGYYTAPRDQRFIDDLYIDMSVTELEAVAAEYRGISLSRIERQISYPLGSEHELCSTEITNCFPENIYADLQFETRYWQSTFVINGEVKTFKSSGLYITNPAIIIDMGGRHGFFLGEQTHVMKAYYNKETGIIIGFVNGNFQSDITYAHFPINIQ